MRTLDIDETCDFLKIERTHAFTLAGNGTLPGAKIGKAWVFLEEDLVEYLRAETRRQMRERQGRSAIETGLAASVAHTPAMVMAPRVASRRETKRPKMDLSAFNDDGTPKLLSQLSP